MVEADCHWTVADAFRSWILDLSAMRLYKAARIVSILLQSQAVNITPQIRSLVSSTPN